MNIDDLISMSVDHVVEPIEDMGAKGVQGSPRSSSVAQFCGQPFVGSPTRPWL
ncbi:MAG: hypothetical protein ACYDDZ_03865 [Acidimicrobiales bacterium]